MTLQAVYLSLRLKTLILNFYDSAFSPKAYFIVNACVATAEMINVISKTLTCDHALNDKDLAFLFFQFYSPLNH